MTLDKGYQINIFFLFFFFIYKNIILWVLIRSASLRHFQWVPIVQSTLVISNSKGLYETLRSSTYQIYGTEEKTINRTTTFNRMNM